MKGPDPARGLAGFESGHAGVPPSPSASLPRFVEPLRDCAGRLDEFVASSELRFLEFSSGLQQAITESQQVAQQAGELLGLLASDELGALQRVLGKQEDSVRTHTGEGDRLVGEMAQRLERTVATLRTIPGFSGSFQRTVRSLRALGVASLIESARLGAEGEEFAGLANEVRDLAEQIAEKFAGVVERSCALEDSLEESRLSALDSQCSQQTAAAQMISGLRCGFEELLSLHSAAREASGGLAGQAEALAEDISSILGLLQEHDITRQRVEHVRDSLLRLVLELEQRGGSEEPVDNPAALVDAVLELQTMQLANSNTDYRAAMDEVRTRIGRLEQATAMVSETVRGLRTVEGQRQVPVLEALRQQLTAVAEGGRNATSANARLAEVLDGSARTAGEITGFVEDIDFIGSELELIAVNAIIKSSHTGEGGKPLAVIAQEIQRQSADARKMTGRVSAKLRQIGEDATALEGLARRFSDDTSRGGNALQGELLSALEGVARADESATHCRENLEGALEAVARALAEARRAGTLDEELGQLATAVGAELSRVRAVAAAQPGAGTQTLPKALLAELAARYTMKSQRLVHQGLESAGSAGEDRVSDQNGGGWDDNVELF